MANITLSEYRARIGQFRGGRVAATKSHTDHKLVHLGSGYKLSKTTRIILFLLLVIHGIESNPGPNSPDGKRRNEDKNREPANQPSTSCGAPREPGCGGTYSLHRDTDQRYSGNRPNSHFIPNATFHIEQNRNLRQSADEPLDLSMKSSGTSAKPLDLSMKKRKQHYRTSPHQQSKTTIHHHIPAQTECLMSQNAYHQQKNQGYTLQQQKCRMERASGLNLGPHTSIHPIQQNVQPQAPTSSDLAGPTEPKVPRMAGSTDQSCQDEGPSSSKPQYENQISMNLPRTDSSHVSDHQMGSAGISSQTNSSNQGPSFPRARDHNIGQHSNITSIQQNVQLQTQAYVESPSPSAHKVPRMTTSTDQSCQRERPRYSRLESGNRISMNLPTTESSQVSDVQMQLAGMSGQASAQGQSMTSRVQGPSPISWQPSPQTMHQDQNHPSPILNQSLHQPMTSQQTTPQPALYPETNHPSVLTATNTMPSAQNLATESCGLPNPQNVQHQHPPYASQSLDSHSSIQQTPTSSHHAHLAAPKVPTVVDSNDTGYREQSSSRPQNTFISNGGTSESIDIAHSTINQGCQNYYNQVPEKLDMTTPEAQQTVANFIKACNDTARKNTKDKVTSTFEHLQTPEKQVNPGFKVTNFYRGETSLESDQYIPDSLYINNTQRSFKGKNIRLPQFLDDVHYAALVADAGAGKTTAAKRFTQLVLNSKISNLRHIKLVHYIRFAEMEWKEKHLTFDLLFKQVLGSNMSNDMKKYGYQWVKEHPSEIMFILDGLDQASWSLDSETYNIDYEQPATAPIIFQNILNEHLLPGCKILITTREHAIQNCPVNIRPKKTIALTGLSNKDRDYLILQLGGSKGQAILEHLKHKSPGLLSLSSTPVFNVFTVAVLLEDLENAPQTMSGILIRVLVYFLNSEHRRVKDIKIVFTKLKELAYGGTSKKRVLFEWDEIRCLGLDVEQINDLVIVTPYLSTPSHFKLMEGYFHLFFCHQSVQEALSALYICEMSLAEFSQFVHEHFDEPHFSVVRRIIFGVLLNSDMNVVVNKPVLDTISDKQNKQLVLTEWLKIVLNHRQNNTTKDETSQSWRIRGSIDIFELYTLLHECGDGAHELIQSNLRLIHYNGRVLAGESLYTVASIMNHCKDTINVKVQKLHPNESDFDLVLFMVRGSYTKFQIGKLKLPSHANYTGFVNNLLSLQNKSAKEKVLKVNSICVEVNDETEEEKRNAVFNFAIAAKSRIRLDGSHLDLIIKCVDDQKEVEVIGRNMGSKKKSALVPDENDIKLIRWIATMPMTKTKSLNLSGNELEPKALHHVGEIVMNAKVENLNLSGCKLNNEKLKELKQSLAGFNGQTKSLNLSRNEMEPKALHHVGEIVMNAKVENLDLSGCKLNDEKLKELKQSLAGFNGQILSFDLKHNFQMEPKALHQVGEIVVIGKVENLNLLNCSLNEEKLRELKKSLAGFNGQVKNLNVSHNEDLHYGLLGDIVRKCQVQELLIFYASTKPKQIDEFISSVGEWQHNVRVKYERNGNFGSVEEWKTCR